jgi:hypothetical protein
MAHSEYDLSEIRHKENLKTWAKELIHLEPRPRAYSADLNLVTARKKASMGGFEKVKYESGKFLRKCYRNKFFD